MMKGWQVGSKCITRLQTALRLQGRAAIYSFYHKVGFTSGGGRPFKFGRSAVGSSVGPLLLGNQDPRETVLPRILDPRPAEDRFVGSIAYFGDIGGYNNDKGR
jgi:hypothetical protein